MNRREIEAMFSLIRRRERAKNLSLPRKDNYFLNLRPAIESAPNPSNATTLPGSGTGAVLTGVKVV
jgi:hypothetical protein